MSFKEFDMSEYFNALDEFQKEHEDQVIKYYGSVEKFNDMIENMKLKEAVVARMAIKEFGSIEKYTAAMKKNLNHLPTIMEGYQKIKSDLNYYVGRTEELTKRLTSDLSKDPACMEIQEIVQEMDDWVKQTHKIVNMDIGENYWGLMSDFHLYKSKVIEVTDEKYGKGSSKFMGEAFKVYSEKMNPF